MRYLPGNHRRPEDPLGPVVGRLDSFGGEKPLGTMCSANIQSNVRGGTSSGPSETDSDEVPAAVLGDPARES